MKIENIILIGAGGLAREIVSIIEHNSANGFLNQRVIGFLDDSIDVGTVIKGYKVLGKTTDFKKFDCSFIYAVGNPKSKIALNEKLNIPLKNFTNVISNKSIFFQTKSLGLGNVFFPNCIVSDNVEIGNFVTILPSNLGHDCKVHDFCTISGFCSINGFVTLNKGVFIGSNSSINPKLTMDELSVLGASSNLITNSKKGLVYYGVPATPLL
jgi:sugar O-acyltransferase (sialic acid O-acetyltransferase NeuD family)